MCNCEEIQSIMPDIIESDCQWFYCKLHKNYLKTDEYGYNWCQECLDNDLDTDLDTKYIWLPRQDQLQNMIIKNNKQYNNLTLLTQVYYYHTMSLMHEIHNISTMEQAWLCLVMEKVHNKKWDGKEWIQ